MARGSRRGEKSGTQATSRVVNLTPFGPNASLDHAAVLDHARFVPRAQPRPYSRISRSLNNDGVTLCRT